MKGECFNCGQACDENHYCYGCDAFICENCEVPWSKADATMGSHTPGEHMEEADDDAA